jgi:hypothetical protein
MAWLGGLLNTVGITPQLIVGLATQTNSSGVPQGIGQVWNGSGQNFYGAAGQALGGALAASAINIALNSQLGTSVVGPQGLSLNTGANILASTITPFITGAVAQGVNQTIQQSLQSAGPFGPILSNLGTGLINQAFDGLAGNLLGNTNTATNFKMFPGAGRDGAEAPADYGGSAYTLTDVVFSLQPANQGPQTAGEAQAKNTPKSPTTQTATQVAGAGAANVPTPTQAAANGVKESSMAQGGPPTTDYDKLTIRLINGEKFSPEQVAAFNPEQKNAFDTFTSAGGLGPNADVFPPAIPEGSWTFITAPEDVSWDIANQSNRVDIFGTNNPPVVAGSRGKRDLTLGNALDEGFVRKVSVEAKVASLEKLLNYSLNASDGFVSVPVYQVWANYKSYGGANAYFIIKDVKVKETMRDLQGDTTRAYVDISLMQVPKYQVNSGRDQASATSAGARSFLDGRGVAGDANQKVAGAANKGGTAATNAAAKPNGGVGVPNGGTGFKSKTGGTQTLTDELPLTSRTN